MDGNQWTVSVNPRSMLAGAQQCRCPNRKWILFACACGRLAWSELPDGLREQIQFAETHAVEYERAFSRPRAAVGFHSRFGGYSQALSWGDFRSIAGYSLTTNFCLGPGQARSERVRKAGLLRDILGNPYLPPPTMPFVPPTVRALAESVFEQNVFAVGPLHDALLDGGLSELATHFQDPAEWHPRGCWAVDLLTGRS